MKKALVFTPSALFRLSHFEISDDWFKDFQVPLNFVEIKRIEIDNFIYFIEPSLENDDTPLVVINLTGEHPVFQNRRSNTHTLERIITVARSLFTSSVKIPVTWREYHDRSLLSIYAQNRQTGDGARINFNTRPNGDGSLYAFATTQEAANLQVIPQHDEIYLTARKNITDAILSEAPSKIGVEASGIILSTRLPQGFSQDASLKQWYESKLTDEQRSFVDKPHDGPVRLRGSAGTGKTVSLVIKAMRDGENAETKQQTVKYGFITHSLASVDMTSAIAESLDVHGLLSGRGCFCTIELRTLYDLANQHLKFTLEGLQPLSLDGREGRRLQFELIEGTLKEMANSLVINAQYTDITSTIQKRWKMAAKGEDSKFIIEIMNEFASILDAEGIRAGEEKSEKYVKGTIHRPKWLIPLEKEIDRRFILEVHRRYRSCLSEMNTLSVDQMVADFNSFLDSNRWDSLRNRFGYDALFVDELHLFTGIERQLLQKLIKKSNDTNGIPKRPAIFMAYDLKQSPNDAFASLDGSGTIFTASTGLQNSDLVKLEKVFRYTPEIADFLSDLDATFPAIDVPGEWNAYSGIAQLANGHRPELTIYPDERTLFKHVFAEAQTLARRISGGGRRVAVLCVSEEMFDLYLPAALGQFCDSMLPVTNREPSSELRHAGKRFIFSMPEYVAGLQFDTVFLLNVDTSEAPADASIGLRRRFISNLYLGSSRAENSLQLASCITRGGASDILNLALSRKSLIQSPLPGRKKR
ncbi:UvrD-helicase domain-containing protein [Chromobacterium haemolyticum]|uniref:UvrD-helicase domain-containing protein n=1 Tax=Chromobacterium haemolyticum TaxID=394935 RepID=UPI004055629F